MRKGRSELGQRPSPPEERRAVVHLTLVEGESTAAERLYERVAPTVSRLVWAFLGPDAERDDVAHDIFVKILRGAGRIREPERLEAWAARVTVNAIKNEFRRRKLRRVLSLDFRDDAQASSSHADFEARELLKRTVRVLERMPVRERMPLTLQLFERAGVEEIARLCGVSERTVKRRLHTARRRFVQLASRDPLLGERLAEDVVGGTCE